jgi:hypothetical protein
MEAVVKLLFGVTFDAPELTPEQLATRRKAARLVRKAEQAAKPAARKSAIDAKVAELESGT